MRYFLLCLYALICGFESQTQSYSELHSKKILLVLSNQQFYGDSDIMTANHFEETVIPYDEFSKAGFKVDFVSPEGGEVPIGYIHTSSDIIARYVFNCSFMNKFLNTLRPEDIDPSAYAAIFYSGGGAAMFGVPENKAIQEIAAHIYEGGTGIVSAICHGTAGLANIKLDNGTYLVADQKINGFPDAFENMNGAYYKEFPFSIEQMMEERGASFVYSETGWDSFYISNDRIITGQDPSSAKQVAQAIIKRLRKDSKI